MVRSVAATLASHGPVIDGRDDDDVWRAASPVTAFRQWQPVEDADASLPTEAKVAYDAANLYVFFRAFDPRPDSIIRVLARRDNWTAADKLGFIVDSYHDRRTAYEFFVNPSGVKVDAAMFNDGNEDGAWDAVWDVATTIDSAGWTAEFRIPLSQLRYGTRREHTFGILLMRDIYRRAERTSWPVLRNSQAGAVSQFGEVTGLADLEAPRRLEAAPYFVASSATRGDFSHPQDVTMGADVKFRVAPNVTLDATVNPDFGQVEADPSVFNLTTVESFFGERRPFFVSGAGQFQLNVNCTAVNDCGTGEGLFYSRRIGRTPQLAGRYDVQPDAPTRILGAGKLTGRLGGGLTIGALGAYTEREHARGDTTIEPAAGFGVVRLRQDLRGGETTIGGMLTAVRRDLDAFSAPYLHRAAYTGAVEFRHRLPGRRFEFSGAWATSRVEGDSAAILLTQTGPVHFYQRDGGSGVDSGATALTGNSVELRFGKVSGQHFMFQTDYQRRSAGFDVNDLGYLQRADQQSWSTWAGYFDRRVTRYYQRFQWNVNWWQYWTADGLAQERAFNTNQHITLKNNFGLHYGGTLGRLGEVYDDRATRGGPLVRASRYIAPWAGINGDDRRRLVPYLWFNWFRGDEGRSRSWSVSPEINLRVGTAFTSGLSFGISKNHDDSQWFRNVPDAADSTLTHHLFARLDQRTLSATARLNYTISPTTSLQVYASPFMTKGTYSDIREVSATPRAERYADRYVAYGDTAVTNDPGGFNFKALQSNVVFRWEYRPGSALFLVWSQGRQGGIGSEGGNNWWEDFQDLTGIHSRNTFLVKLSYWLNR